MYENIQFLVTKRPHFCVKSYMFNTKTPLCPYTLIAITVQRLWLLCAFDMMMSLITSFSHCIGTERYVLQRPHRDEYFSRLCLLFVSKHFWVCFDFSLGPNFELTQLMFFIKRLKQPGGQAFLSSESPTTELWNYHFWSSSENGAWKSRRFVLKIFFYWKKGFK